jgi:isochorismate synthase EntC
MKQTIAILSPNLTKTAAAHAAPKLFFRASANNGSAAIGAIASFSRQKRPHHSVQTSIAKHGHQVAAVALQKQSGHLTGTQRCRARKARRLILIDAARLEKVDHAFIAARMTTRGRREVVDLVEAQTTSQSRRRRSSSRLHCKIQRETLLFFVFDTIHPIFKHLVFRKKSQK